MICQEPQGISIHALLAESDRSDTNRPCKPCNFYPRSPCGERLASAGRLQIVYNFYPRSPCGERHRYGRPIDVQFVFLSTLSLRRATVDTLILTGSMLFLSTLSLRRATTSIAGRITSNGTFLSTLSLRRATNGGTHHEKSRTISIHALLAESDAPSPPRREFYKISIHALLAESDSKFAQTSLMEYISIHALLAESD